MSHRLIVLLLCLVVQTGVANELASPTTLEVGRSLDGHVLANGDSRFYQLASLLPDQFYEIRVSYPATMPTDFYMTLLPLSSLGSTGRSLLNTAKLLLSTSADESGVSVHTTSASFSGHAGPLLLNLTAVHTGVAPLHLDSPATFVVYNIVLEHMMAPNVPFVYALAAVVLLLLAVVAYNLPSLTRYIYRAQPAKASPKHRH